MSSEAAARRAAGLGPFSRGAGVVVALVGLLVLVTWALGMGARTGIIPGSVSIKPNTAIGLVLAGLALWLRGRERTGSARRLPEVCAIAVALIGLLTLCEYLFGWHWGLDQLLFREPAGAPGTSHPGRMAPNTALSFVLLGAALFGLDVGGRRTRRVAEGLALLASIVAFLALIGYAYGVEPLYRLSSLTRMALPTALLFLLLSFAALLGCADGWVASLVLNEGAGGLIVRRQLPTAAVIVFALGWLVLEGQQIGLYGAEFGASLRTTLVIVVLAGLIFWSAGALRRIDAARTLAEGAVRESEHRLVQILEALPVGVFVVDGAGHPYSANRTAQEILGKGLVGGVDAGELPAVYQAYRAGTDEVYPADAQPIVKALAGQRVRATDIEIRRPDRTVPIDVWASPVRDADGRVAYAVAAFADTTERERARAEIEKLNVELSHRVAELEAVNRELDTFCHSVSHDLRAPLRAIDGFSRVLLEDHGTALGTEAQRLLGVIRASTQRMGQLIDDLLTFSRFSRRHLAAGPVDMGVLVRAVVDELRPTAPAATDIVVAPLPAATGDAALLRQVWANLVGNALKFSRTRSAPRVEIGAQDGQRETVFFVRDNGVGFDMEYVGKLFGVFQRLHRAEEFEGSGVGLAIVQRIVHRHGGRVWAEARPEAGAAFYFTLPASE